MKDHESTKDTVDTPGTAAPRLPELPAWKAFVIQFNRETESEAATFGGRIEHLSSGRRVRFESAADLIAGLQRLLAEVGGGDPPEREE